VRVYVGVRQTCLQSVTHLLLSLPTARQDRRSAVEKLNAGAEGYDRTSASAANLNAFDALIMAPGTFREALRVLFNIHVTPKVRNHAGC